MDSSTRSSKGEQPIAQDHLAILPPSASSTVNTERPARLVTITLQGSGFYPQTGLAQAMNRVYHYKVSIIDSERLLNNTRNRLREIENRNPFDSRLNVA